MNNQETPLIVKIEGRPQIIDKRFIKVSQLLSNVTDGGTRLEQEIELQSNFVTQETFLIAQQYYENNDFNPTLIQRNSLNADQLFINQHDKNLMLQYDPFRSDHLKRFVEMSVYMGMQAFKRLCLARIAYEFPFDPKNPKSFDQMTKRFDKVKAIRIEDIEKYKIEYPQICNDFK